MPNPSHIPELPARLLADPEMITACRDRDFSKIFTLVRRAGLYPYLIAQRTGLTPSRVGEVISKKRKLRDMQVIERVSDGLRVPGHMLGLARRPWEAPAAGSPAAKPEAVVPASSLHTVQPVSAIPGTDLDSILTAATGPRLSPSTLRALHSSIEDYWRRDDEHGGEVLRPAVVGQLRYVVDLIKEASEGAYRDSLFGIAAELARLTGWIYFDARQYSQARTYFAESLQLAKAINDRPFMANVLACMSLQATYEDKLADAVALSTAAQDTAREHGATPRVMSMLSMREAFAHASMSSHGARLAAHASLAEAHRQFERISPEDPDPAWVTYFDEPKLIVDTGIAHGRLGEAQVAEPLIADALQREDARNQRGRAFHAFWLATTQLQRGNVDQACSTATLSLETASSVGSERVMGHLRDFQSQLAPYSQQPEAVAFRTRLRAALQ
ncbi:tetratricopeptide (TPR) repeat protein [Streptomyces syringium]|uniref:Tetratricopeptide (TPR) repeat protein n=1 Tax=Streptomyces syringium TaxID=76729 RepID=A0ABS4Y5J4_9ACTN|nr:tetratricopeptide (TPR) repeat protein [Streptomyces syringium]